MNVIAIVKYVFTLIGIGLLVGAFYSFKNTQNFLTAALPAEGTVVRLIRSEPTGSTTSGSEVDSPTYRPVVAFDTQAGKAIKFTSSTGSNPPSYSVGEVVEILYQENSPEQAKINSFFSLWGLSTILGGMGSVFFLVGFSIILFGCLKGKKIEYLRKNGVPIKARFQSVEINGALEVNGRNPYQIYVQWENPTTSKLHIFKSENIWFDPSGHISDEEITVLIEKDNPKKYHVDTSFLPIV